MLPSLWPRRLCPAPSKWSDVHCSSLSTSWWAGQGTYRKPCGIITGALQGLQDASDTQVKSHSVPFTQPKSRLSFMLPPVQHKTAIHSSPIKTDTFLTTLLTPLFPLWPDTVKNLSVAMVLGVPWWNWAQMLVNLGPAFWVSAQFSTMKRGYLQGTHLWKSQHPGSAK